MEAKQMDEHTTAARDIREYYPAEEIARADVPSSPLQKAVGHQMEELGELEEYLTMLEKRLRPVRYSMPENKTDGSAKLKDAIDTGSEVVQAVNSSNLRIRRCRQRINTLLETLEV